MRILNINKSRIKFDDVLKDYERPIYHYIRRMVVDHDDAADIMQETFLKVYQGLGNLRDEKALKSWVYKIATNEALRFLSRRREELLSVIDENELLLGRLAEGEYVDYDDKMAVDFQKALLSLSEQQRLVFNMRYYDELSYDEISDITGCSVGTLKVQYHNAKERIKNYMLNE
jgi:RNA polymerase sigma-70 factor (ECF subfamily)